MAVWTGYRAPRGRSVTDVYLFRVLEQERPRETSAPPRKTLFPLPSNNRDLSKEINIISSMNNKRLVIKNAYNLLDEINKYSIINTNRLHGAIGGSLLNKHVKFYPNSYWKNQEVYNYSLRDDFPKTIFYGL